jgi:integrase/recombinase XerD
MKLAAAIEYFKICKLADGYSPNTIELYGWALDRLLKFCAKSAISEISEISIHDLRQYIVYMRDEYKPNRPGGSTAPLSPSSLENIWKALRSFFSWAEEELGITRPDLRLAKPPNPPPEINPYTHQEIQALVAACERTALSSGKRQPFTMRRPTGLRDKAIVLTLLDTGLRAGELCRLKIQDLNQDKLYVAPYGSGRKTKSRMVYLGRSTTRAIHRYLIERNSAAEREPLFITRRGDPLNRNTVRHMITSLGNRAGVSNTYPHRFRHTFAIQYLRNGGDVFTLQRLLGHSTLEMVRRYLQLADRDAAEAHRVASPVDRWSL